MTQSKARSAFTRLYRLWLAAFTALAMCLDLIGSQHAVCGQDRNVGLPIAEAVFKAPLVPGWADGKVITVRSVSELFQAVETASPTTTVLIAAGRYSLPRRLEIRTSRLTLRGATGRAADVILDGGKHSLGELLVVHGCSDVTIADLTVSDVRWNGIKLDTDSGVHRVLIHHCIIHNVWQRGVKGVRVPPNVARPADCVIQYCLFYNDRPKTYADDAADNEQNFRGNYIGGIDVMFAKGWIIRDNVFYQIQGRTREGRGAIFLWHESENCVVERNAIIDCDVGIALGNSFRPDDVVTHVRDTIVRNNFVVRCPETGILADYTEGCRIVHNTIFDPQSRLGRLIRIVHENPGLLVANNLLVGPEIRVESRQEVRMASNLVVSQDPQWFVDSVKGDLHLRLPPEVVVGKAARIDDVQDDFDGNSRDDRPDIGADEWQSGNWKN